MIWICNAWKDPENLTEQHSPLNFQYNNKALLFFLNSIDVYFCISNSRVDKTSGPKGEKRDDGIK